MPLYQVEAYYAQNTQFVNYRNAKLQNTKRNTKYKSEFSLHQLLISLAKFSAHFNTSLPSSQTSFQLSNVYVVYTV